MCIHVFNGEKLVDSVSIFNFNEVEITTMFKELKDKYGEGVRIFISKEYIKDPEKFIKDKSFKTV